VDLVASKDGVKYLIQVKSPRDYINTAEIAKFKEFCRKERAKATMVVVCNKQMILRYL
jgi:Holliday junction resolvase